MSTWELGCTEADRWEASAAAFYLDSETAKHRCGYLAQVFAHSHVRVHREQWPLLFLNLCGSLLFPHRTYKVHTVTIATETEEQVPRWQVV